MTGTWLQKAIDTADLCQSYIEIVSDKFIDLTEVEKEELRQEIATTEVDGPEAAAALAVVQWLLDNPDEE